MPILSVKRINEMSVQLMTSQALFQAFGSCSPEPLCLSLGVSILLTHHGPSLSLWNDCGQKFLFYCRKFRVCHHQQKGRFCWLALWRLRDNDSESHSLVSAVVFHLWVTFFAWETKVCLRFASLWSVTHSLLLNEGKSLVSPCAHCLPIQLHKVSSQVFDVTWMLLSKIA